MEKGKRLMRVFAIASMLMLAACAAETETDAQVSSTPSECNSVDDCKAYIERQDVKTKLLKDADGLLETPEEIKQTLRREHLSNNIRVSASGIPSRAAYTDEEWQQHSERLKSEPRKPFNVITTDRAGNKIAQVENGSISCKGVAKQGGAVLCQTAPNAKVKVARSEKDFYFEQADEKGRIIIGFDRDETANFIEAQGERVTFDIASQDYDISRIDGLPPSQVSSFSESQLKRIRSSSARKKKGFASRAQDLGFIDGFELPIKAEYIKTTNFGAQRILNGISKKPHYGVDLAAPIGTPIYAPADGVVSLADDDLYFEGAMVLLDHGQGLISMYLHVDSITVEDGQVVKQGEQIATVGSKGRSTGPHLCWRLKWRNRNLNPELLTKWPKHEH